MQVKTMISYQVAPDALPGEMEHAVERELGSVISDLWFKTFLPRHFTPRAMSLYAYTARSAEYLKRKLRVKHHQDPLVWTGTLKAMVTGAITVHTKRQTAEGRMNVPRYLYQYRTTKVMKKDKELIAVAPGEMQAMTDFLQRRIADRIELARVPEEILI